MQGLKVDGYTQMETDFEWSLISCRQIIERTTLWATKTSAMQMLSLEWMMGDNIEVFLSQTTFLASRKPL